MPSFGVSNTRTTLIRCAGICDGRLSVAGSRQHPAGLLVERAESGLRALALGRLQHVRQHPASASAQTIDCTDAVVIPGLINAHTHLDLTVIGPLPHEPSDGFAHWVHRIRAGRPTEPAAIAASVQEGVALSRAGGVVAVGDICGAVHGSASLIAADALRSTGIAGVSFVEFFAIGTTERERLAATLEIVQAHHVRFQGRHRLGLQPHATNTVSRWAFAHAIEAARALGLPTMTHLAESPEERQFVAEADGPQRKLLEELGLWTEPLANEFGRGLSPIEQLHPVLLGSGTAAVHVNQCSDADLDRLVAAQTPVVYCPRASDYFEAQAHFGPHRYRDMLEAGLTVALGTDSIVNLPAGSDRLSPLDEIRFLHRRDGTDPMTLLRMATINGAAVLGLGESAACLAPEAAPLGIVAVPVMTPAEDADISNPALAVARSESAPRIVLD